MHGGKREGSGRNPLPDDKKKIAKTIYITPTQNDDIELYAKGDSFSEKCLDLITTQIERRKRFNNSEVTFIDLFAGLGGIRLGFETAFRKKRLIPTSISITFIQTHLLTIGNYGDNTHRSRSQ